MTPKQEKFCQEIVKGKSQADAYRAAYKTKHMKTESVYQMASKLMKSVNISSRVAELMDPIVEKAQFTREQWIEDGMRLYRGDVRNLFDEHGNAKDIPSLSDSEADCIEGFEVVEDFTKVAKNDGTEDAVPTGYTKKIKWTSRKARHEYLGKALGYYTEKTKLDVTVTVEHLVEMITRKEPVVVNG
jgi:hypothetical protein